MKTAQEKKLLAKAERMGLTVEFRHNGQWDGRRVTRCDLMDYSDPDKPVRWAAGEAHCSHRDRFNKMIGRSIALGRAFRNLEIKHPGYDGAQTAGAT